MKVQSRRSWEGKGARVNIPLLSLPASEVIVTEPSNVCIRTVLHECILTVCTSHAALAETGANRCLCKEPLFNLTIKRQISHRFKASGVKQSQQIDVALLKDFSVWVCKAALFAIPLCCWKKYTLKTRVSRYGMVFQCVVRISFHLILVQLVVQSLLF